MLTGFGGRVGLATRESQGDSQAANGYVDEDGDSRDLPSVPAPGHRRAPGVRAR